MSLQSAEQFTIAVAHNPALSAEVTQTASAKTPEEAAQEVVAIGKREGYDFSAAEALQTRQALTASELDTVAGGGSGYDPVMAKNLSIGTGALAGQLVPGIGGIAGAGIGAGVATAIGGGSASDSLVNGAMAANKKIEETKSVVQQIFSTKW